MLIFTEEGKPENPEKTHPRSQALFLSLLEGEKDPGWGWSRGSEHKI
jgi:hypothetical protein